jgi:hypothetical protein
MTAAMKAMKAMKAIEAGVLDTRCSMLRRPQHRAAIAVQIALGRTGGMTLIVSWDGQFAHTAERLLDKRDFHWVRRVRLDAGDGTRIWLAGSLAIDEAFDLAIVDAAPGFGGSKRWRTLRQALRMPPVVWLQEGTGTVPPWANEPARTPLQRAAIKLALDEYRMSIAR